EGPINQIGGDYPGAYSVAYLDGYFVFVQSGDSGRWFISGLFDPLSYDALDFAYADAAPNVARLVIAHRGEIWLLGEALLKSGATAATRTFRSADNRAALYGSGAPIQNRSRELTGRSGGSAPITTSIGPTAIGHSGSARTPSRRSFTGILASWCAASPTSRKATPSMR